MKNTVSFHRSRLLQSLVLLTSWLFVFSASAQERIYRCGNEYTNTIKDAKSSDCKVVEGGNVTIVQSAKKPAPVAAPAKAASNAQAASQSSNVRTDNAEQKARDSDSRGILESELKKAETKQADLLKEYNNGEPDKLGPETKNHQKYLDRVADLKANIARNEADINGIKRELNRGSPSR